MEPKSQQELEVIDTAHPDYQINELQGEIYANYANRLSSLKLALDFRQDAGLNMNGHVMQLADEHFFTSPSFFPNYPNQISYYINPPLNGALKTGTVSGNSWVQGMNSPSFDLVKGCLKNTAWNDSLGLGMHTPFSNILAGRDFKLDGTLPKQEVLVNVHHYGIIKLYWELVNSANSEITFFYGTRIEVFDVTSNSMASGKATLIAHLDAFNAIDRFTPATVGTNLKGSVTKYYTRQWDKFKFNAEAGKKYFIAVKNLITINNANARAAIDFESCIIPWA